MMVETSRLPGEFYRNSFIAPGESDGSGSSGHHEGEIFVSEDSSVPMRKCTESNSNRGVGFHVPWEVVPVSGISASARKSLIHRLKIELEQIQVLQKKLILDKNSYSNLPKGKPVNAARTSVLETPAREVNKGLHCTKSGKVSPATQAPMPNASNVMLMKQCDALLKWLMNHQYGWVFSKPVDVKALNILNYFDVIKHPMDLGTIKSRLGSGSYSTPLEFVLDVRLTFSNAITFNPPGNHVHIMADTLSTCFELRWKNIEKKLGVNVPLASPAKSGLVDDEEVSKSIIAPKKRKIPPGQHEVSTPTPLPPKRMMASEEKQKLGLELETLLGEIPERIVDFLRMNCSNRKELGEEEIEIDIDGLCDDVLFSLKRLLDEHHQEKQRNEAYAEASGIEMLNESGLTNSSIQPCNEYEEEDVDIGRNEPPVSTNNLAGKDRVSETSKWINSGSSSDSGHNGYSGGRPSAKASSRTYKPKVREVVGGLEVNREKTNDPFGTNHSVSELDQVEHASIQKSSPWELDSGHDGESGPNDPEKSYRVAVLKGRFADTILKAREKTLQQVDKDPDKLWREREELQMRQRMEKARMQAEAKAAEDARRRAEAKVLAEVKRKRELEREAARRALLLMEKTVEIDESSSFLKDLEMLKAVVAPVENLPSSANETSHDHSLEGFGSFKFGVRNPLEQLGLFMKADEEEEEAAEEEVEEGEI